ncbi:MAG: hypothetical protein HLUCCA05_04630 [Roseibaca calidilacus]|uniref:Uncharacterized protein n=1 Tax=Roseibaca calidilacus TaxID=1666912 RepID=A0A0P7W379_9RHOB|nr:MAG: hypothetical protein HLUCCA05_04630 [Roseibaca calidilacus]
MLRMPVQRNISGYDQEHPFRNVARPEQNLICFKAQNTSL